MVDIQLFSPTQEGDQEEALFHSGPRTSQQSPTNFPLVAIKESSLMVIPTSKNITQSTAATTINYDSAIDDNPLEYQRKRRKRWLIGYLLAVGTTLFASAIFLLQFNANNPTIQGSAGLAVLDYLEIFRWSNHSSAPSHPKTHPEGTTHQLKDTNRHLLGITEDPSDFPQLVVAGKMTVEGGPCNIAQFNLKTKEWSLTERIQLSLYNSYSGGEVYSLLANHTFLPSTADDSGDDESSGSEYSESTFRRCV